MIINDHEASVLFRLNYASKAQIVINQGGTSSGKTYAIIQVLFCLAAQKEKQIITIVGQDIPNLKAGPLRDALSIYNNSAQIQALVRAYNKTDRVFEFNNGTLLEFKSYANPQDAKSGKRDYLFINEANGIEWQINIRLKITHTYTSQIGVRELTGRNDGKAVEMYLQYCGLPKGQPWCASFVCWTYGQNKVANPHSGYCPDLFTSKNIVWKRNAQTNIEPQRADIFGLFFPEKGRIAHVGFIERWASTTISTVEGNTNQAGSREGDGVYRKIRLTRQIYAVARYIK